MVIKVTRRFDVRNYIANELEDTMSKLDDGIFYVPYTITGWRLGAWRIMAVGVFLPVFVLLLVLASLLAIINGVIKSVFPFMLHTVAQGWFKVVSYGKVPREDL